MKKLTMLVEIISTIGAFASILWLFLDPGPEPFVASLAALVVILGIGIRAQVQLSKIQYESLSEKLLAIQEIMKVTTDIPRLTENQLLLKFEALNRNQGATRIASKEWSKAFPRRRTL
jgi:hypothetical protein